MPGFHSLPQPQQGWKSCSSSSSSSSRNGAGPQDAPGADPHQDPNAGFSRGDLRGFPGTSGGSRLFAQSPGKSLAKQALDIIPGSGESRCLL